MSNAQAKAERSRAKDVRQGVTEQTPGLPKAKRGGAKLYALIATPLPGEKKWPPRLRLLAGSDWRIGRYETRKQAEQAKAAAERGWYARHYSLRIDGPPDANA